MSRAEGGLLGGINSSLMNVSITNLPVRGVCNTFRVTVKKTLGLSHQADPNRFAQGNRLKENFI